MTTPAPHPWQFSRIGGFDQALLTSGDDLRNLDKLDPKLWAALALPVKGLHFDERSLHLIDHNKDGRVRQPEIVAAVQWACACLKNPDVLLQPEARLALAEIDDTSAEGAAVLSSARTMLDFLGKPDASFITLDDVESQQTALIKAPLNGDGIILSDSAEDPSLQALIADIQTAYPGVTDASGKPGIDANSLAQFYDAVAARAAWLAQNQAQWVDNPALDFTAAYAALTHIRTKLDDYFSRCRAARFDARAAESLNQPQAAWTELSAQSLSADCRELIEFPLAVVTAEPVLPLGIGVNPAWEPAVQAFRQTLVQPLLGAREQLTLGEWQDIKQAFDAYQSWLDAEAGQTVAGLSAERIQQVAQEDRRAELLALIDADLAVQPKVQAFAAVEKLVRFRLHLKTLLNNSVNFTEFYSHENRSVFEAGTLYLDGRACELCIEVYDMAKHASLAGLSKCFLAYCDCSRPDGAKKTIVAAFTGGDADYLLVGRNGIFFDRQGQDWDATITKLIENPISISQAFFLPYKRLIRFVEERAAKSAAASDASSQSLLESTTDKTLSATDPKAAQAVKPKFDIGIVAALGVAVGGVTTALGMLLQAFFGLGWLMPLGLVGLLILISGPSLLIAWLKLRQRNLGPILDASDWAVNGQVKINVPFGGKLTEVAKLPPGSRRNLVDPYAEKSRPWGLWLVLLLVLISGAVTGGWYCVKGEFPWSRFTQSSATAPQAAAPPAASE